MGISRSKPAREWPPAPPPEPRVEVPPLIEPPPNAARTRMQVPGYEQWFGKPSLRSLFDDYFNQAGSVNAGVMLKMLQDPHVDLTATGGIGSFATIPLQAGNSMLSENNSVIGLRYDSQNLSLGATVVPFLLPGEEPSMVPYGAWLVGRIGGLSAGAQYKPLNGSMNCLPFEDLKNWDYAISYDVGSASPLSPSLNFSLELVRSTQLVASFYQHQVVLREVKGGPRFEDADEIVNYIDFGVELATRVGKDKPTDDADNSSFQIAANWQANKNFLVKGKLGPSKSSVALAFKSWWKPMFTLSFTAVNDHAKGTRGYGFGIHVDDQRDPDSSHLL
ncbi:uncharacterized protein LOC125533162 [Triticum urartu]|uniref:uncharacterized protein LOC125533162 n=1 Tax=Triticum urartu TaxID=4572 RepID=UPI0020435808|nr:uncharacterized protein LOC125533162 [Triticum urartu]